MDEKEESPLLLACVGDVMVRFRFRKTEECKFSEKMWTRINTQVNRSVEHLSVAKNLEIMNVWIRCFNYQRLWVRYLEWIGTSAIMLLDKSSIAFFMEYVGSRISFQAIVNEAKMNETWRKLEPFKSKSLP